LSIGKYCFKLKRTDEYGYQDEHLMSMAAEHCGEKIVRRVPRGEKRKDQIAAVAERIFLRRGFTETTMQIIATEAGASKETLYRHFGSKEELFSEVIRSRSARITGNEGELPLEVEPRQLLRDLGLRLVRFVVNRESLSLYRAIVSEVGREPELGQIFYKQGPGRVIGQLARYLAAAHSRGILCCPEPGLAARLFLGAVLSNYQILGLVAPDESEFIDEKIQTHVAEAVELFLARYEKPVSHESQNVNDTGSCDEP